MGDEILDDDKNEELDENTEPSSLDMSDEDFLKADPSDFLSGELDETDKDESAEDKVDDEKDETETVEEDESKADTEDSKDNSDATNEDTESTNKPTGKDSTDTSVAKKEEDTEAEDESKDKPDATEVDYKSELEKVMAPFVANGVEMKPKSAEDVVRLMQMGANYHKKMAGLKPSMKVLKLLEKNDLLDQDKLNYLIDLNAKDPAAITKLLKDSGIDPLDINVKDEPNYKPTSRNVSDTEIDLDQVLDSIKGTPDYNKTLNVITKIWDDASRTVAANNPNIIQVINGHIADGTYDRVMGAVEYERSLGNMQGISDLDAYKQMGDKLQSEGKLEPTTPEKKVPAKVVKQKVEPKDDAKRQAKKKSAAPTSNRGKVASSNFNPLEMSDEEIMKFDESQLPTG